jgi:hypothetical protein
MASVRTAVLLGAVTVGTLAVYVGIFVIDTTKDRPDTLDVQPVKGVAAQACTTLRVDLDALPPLPADASPQQRQDRLAAQDRAVRTLVTTVQAVGEPALRKDVPAKEWLGDWTTIADARRAYPLTERMNAVGLPECVVPASLTTAP